MRVLLTNDDGIAAPGLWAAARALRPVGEVVVCAPDREQSGTGTAISLLAPLRVARVPARVSGVRAFAVEGTPADCVVLALERLVEKPVDLLVSGINQGANLGEDVFLSGTVGAALQGYFRGIPSIAISVASLKSVRYRPAAALLGALAGAAPRWQGLAAASPGLSRSDGPGRAPILNVNLPNLPPARLRGVVVTHLGHRTYTDSVKDGDDGRRSWYWITRERPQWEEEEGSDVWAIRRRKVSITPIFTDLTAHAALPLLEGIASEAEGALGRSTGHPELG